MTTGMWGLRSSRTLVMGTSIIVFVVCGLLPVGYMLVHVGATGASSAPLWLDPRQRALLVNTTLLGVGASIGATLLGAPLGVALARVDLPRQTVLRLALAAPALVPPYIVALVWTYLTDSRGLLASLAGRGLPTDWTYSLPAAVLVLSVVLYPLSMLATEVAVRRVDGRLEEAAWLVAPPARVLRGITLPLAAPAIAAAALVIFVLAISEFGVPGLLRVRVYTTEVFTAFAALYDIRRATILALPLLGLCLLIAVVAVGMLGERIVTTRRAVAVRPLSFNDWRRPALFASIAVLLAALALPVTILVREALGARSLRAGLDGSGRAIANSLWLAAAGATFIVATGLWLGYARARARSRLGGVADVLFIVVFAVPSTIVGVGLIGLWNRPGLLGAIYGTDVMLLLAYTARFMPVAALALAASVRTVPASHEEAAAVSGAGWLRTMAWIVVPQVRLGLLAAWVITFVLAFGELGASILVAPPGETTLPIRIYTLIANAPPSNVALLALLQVTVIFAPLAALGAVLARREVR